jgi:NAD(P)-dependent dehydrogenase (short-subunit alcohol dehydrogenase family)
MATSLSASRRTVLVTGGGSGIGKAVALTLAEHGFRVAITGRRAALLEEVAGALGPDSLAHPADVTDPDQVKRLFEAIAQTFGRLDVLFNNAGINTPSTPFEAMALRDWHSVIETNLTAAFLCAQAAFIMMKEQVPRGGRIINNGSISATSPRPQMVAYTASKHGVLGLTKAISLEGRQYGIACGQIDIGNVVTPLADRIAKGTLQADLTVRAEPMFDVRHVADAVVYMANLPLDVNVQSMTVLATTMPYVGRG